MSRRLALRWGPLVASGLLCLVFLAGLLMDNPQHLPSALVGKKVPVFSIPTLDGAVDGLTAQDLVTGQPVILNVWASWCGPCRVEHPHLMRLAKTGVPIFGLNYKDTSAAAARFLAVLGNPYQKIGADRSGRSAIDLGVYGVPESFVLDGQGRILMRHAGPLDQQVLAQHILPILSKEGGDELPR